MPRLLVIDSGAGETVLPKEWCLSHPVADSPGKGVEYYVAAGGKVVHNEGQKRLLISNLEGEQVRQMTFQVAEVKIALGSVNSIVRNWNRVVLDLDEHGKDVAFTQNRKSGDNMWMRVERGVYLLDVLVGPHRIKVRLPKRVLAGRVRSSKCHTRKTISR